MFQKVSFHFPNFRISQIQRYPFWGSFFVIIVTALFMFRPIPLSAQQGDQDQVIRWWSFDQESGHATIEEISQQRDSINGKFEYVPGISGKAIKLDGFRTFIEGELDTDQTLNGPFTVEGWIALASYPWSWAPLVDCSFEKQKGFFFGIDTEGHVGFKIAAGNSWFEATTDMQLPLREWAHIAAVYTPDQNIAVYVNGELSIEIDINGNYVPAWGRSLTIGRNTRSQTWYEAQLTTEDTYFFLDGILDEVKITANAKTGAEIGNIYASATSVPEPALSRRDKLPKGPVGQGNFGAFYTHLNYYKEWDDMWRVGDVPDLFIRFDESPVQFVFWRGTSFTPCWVSENDIWYTNEWLETWGSDVVSCAEPIMDRDCRYSHVRLIENTEARVVIHWRYALNDAFYDFVAIGDDGRGEWCDEYHIIYPDQVGIRKMELHYSKPERKHDWVEQIVLLPPGKYPDDAVENEAITLINMEGEVQGYKWNEDLEVQMPEPEGANMSLVNTKSEYKPFFILPPGPVETVEGNYDAPFFRTYASHMASTRFRPDPAPTEYGWWDHWPVAQVPGDGRWVITPDRPSHFNLTTFVQWNDYKYTERTRTRIMLQGMTNKKASELVPLAKSWIQAPEMDINSNGFSGGVYDQSERAYIIKKESSNKGKECSLVLKASKESPLINPAIIIRNWGSNPATLKVNGKEITNDDDFRQGILKGMMGDDLIVWIRMDEKRNVKLTLK